MKTAVASDDPSNDDIRDLVLQYLYERHSDATSARGKRGAAVKISDLKRAMKERHQLRPQAVLSNLFYLISQGWVSEQFHQRVVPVNNGRQIPSTTTYYAITALGVDRIEGPGEYTPRSHLQGIQIHASGQSIVTVGDGNQVNAKYELVGQSFAHLAEAIKHADELSPARQIDAIADVQTIQSQLSRSTPQKEIIRSAWDSLQSLSTMASLANAMLSAAKTLSTLLA